LLFKLRVTCYRNDVTRCHTSRVVDQDYCQVKSDNPRDITDITSDAMASPKHLVQPFLWHHSPVHCTLGNTPSSIPIPSMCDKQNDSYSAYHHQAPRHHRSLIGSKPLDASDMVAIIRCLTILPVWLRNTPVRPVWS